MILGLVASALLAPRLAEGADPAAPNEEPRKAAAASFTRGEQAFTEGDFLRAAELFDAAYAAAPHHAALWNAARAYHRAGEDVKATTRYAQYLKEAPTGNPDRDSATTALRELSARVGRIDIYAPGVDNLRVDGAALAASSAYVNPGTHLIAGRVGERALAKSVTVLAGATVSVALSPEPSEKPVTPPPLPPPAAVTIVMAPPSPPPPPVSRWLSPGGITVATGGALTVIALGVTIFSGADTLAARKRFDDFPSQPNLESGRARQLRTNVLIGVTAGLGALTGAAAVFLMNWGHGSKRVTVKGSVAPASHPSLVFAGVF